MTKIDHYTFNARVLPALIIAAPIAMILFTWLPNSLFADDETWVKSLTKGAFASGVATAVAFALAQWIRNAGKRLEDGLLPKWDGLPSVCFLRHRDKAIDAVSKDRYHRRLVELGAVASMPALTDELRDPVGSDAFYMSASTWLRTNTRDEKKFSLLYKENVNYGFHRNLLAGKTIGLALCVAAACSSGFAFYLGKSPVAESLVTGIIFVYLNSAIGEQALYRVACEYAKRLLEAIDQIEPKRTTAERHAAPMATN
ncbi:hypothetical protein [Methylosinus sp. Ce-a6]|uniref:hypothetical protein n=1 Tax=Methylosinus sp. Ce-a6 TaxID=2172005 RepID=UPI00135ABD41|nr:hypothetical protein [Methylosinus sp. Ce-a6]